jgi:hypothetical protein
MTMLEDVLEALVRRYVPESDGVLDSVCVPEVNDALRALAWMGRVEIVEVDRSRIRANWRPVVHRSSTDGDENLWIVPEIAGFDRQMVEIGD